MIKTYEKEIDKSIRIKKARKRNMYLDNNYFNDDLTIDPTIFKVFKYIFFYFTCFIFKLDRKFSFHSNT